MCGGDSKSSSTSNKTETYSTFNLANEAGAKSDVISGSNNVVQRLDGAITEKAIDLAGNSAEGAFVVSKNAMDSVERVSSNSFNKIVDVLENNNNQSFDLAKSLARPDISTGDMSMQYGIGAALAVAIAALVFKGK